MLEAGCQQRLPNVRSALFKGQRQGCAVMLGDPGRRLPTCLTVILSGLASLKLHKP
jgi:hypothetical protein